MQVSELMNHYDHYKNKLHMPEDRARTKAVDAYNSAHPKDKSPDDIWERLEGKTEGFMLNAQKENQELTRLRKENEELKKLFDVAVIRIKKNESEIQALCQNLKDSGEENATLREDLDEATKPQIDAEIPKNAGDTTKTESKTKKK